MAKTISELKAQSAEVKNASAIGENTATRVGQLFGDIVEHVEQYENTKNDKDASQDAQMQSLVSAEESRAKGEERGLQNQIHAEKIDRQTADTYLGNLIQQESSARETADENIRTALANETARAQAAEQELAAAQIYTAKIKDGAVTTPKIADGAVTYEKTDIIAQDLGTNITKVPSQKVVTDAISKEETERKADVNGLAAALASETINREQGDENLNAAIEAEAEARDNAINNEAQARSQNDALLNQAIVAEKDRAMAAEEANATAIIGTERIADGAVTYEKLYDKAQEIMDIFAHDTNPDYLYVCKDSNDNIVWWITSDGKVDWCKGIPSTVVTELQKLNEKLNEEINNKFSEGITSIENLEASLMTEIEHINTMLSKKVDGYYDDDPEFIYVVKDNNNNILGGVKNDGYNYIPKLLVDLLSVNGKEINGEAISSIYYDNNPEYVHVVKDNAHNLIFAINNNGDIYPLKYFFDKINLSLKSNENKISETEGKITDIETEIQTIKNNVSDLTTSDIYPLISAIIPTSQCVSFYAENNTLFIGSSDGKIYKYDISVESNPVYLGSTTKLAIKGHVRSIVSNGDYIYATLRGNGSGMDNDSKYPLFLASFELGLTDLSQNHDSFDAYIKTGDTYIDETGDPCPSRWLHSAKLYKGEGSSFAKLIKNQEISEEAYISLWFRSDNTLNGNVYIPVIFNDNSDVVSFVISEDNKIGVSVGETMSISDIVIDNEWKNIKLTYKGNTIKVYIRNKECNSIWTEVISVDSVTLVANQIGIGINSVSNNVTVYVDEYCYDTIDLDLTTNINGVVSIIRKSDLSIVNEYKLNMRGCSSYIYENYLFVGMIGGLNIYDISTGDSAKLVGFNRDSSKRVNYPKGDAEYKIRVPFIEIQKMHMYNNDGRNYIVGGNDVRGIVIYNVTDIHNPTLYKEVLDIPNVSSINNEGTTINYPQYIEWDVKCEYPYIYSTVAALHRYRKDLQLVDENDLVYGLKIRDISNIDNITSIIVRMNKDDYPDYISSDGDSRPVSFCFVKNKIVMGNCNKGIAIFEKNGFESRYFKSMEMLYDTRICHVQSTRDGRVFASDYTNGLKNVYILKGII